MSAARVALRTRAFAVLLLAGGLLAGPSAGAQEAVILVRHAEKVDESDDPDLSAKGKERAQALARILARAGVDAIYVTRYKRTVQTAGPLAQALRLEARVADGSDDLVRRLRAEHGKDVVLVVGHTNTVPEIIQKLGHGQTITIPSDEYHGLWVVVPRPGGAPSVLRLSY